MSLTLEGPESNHAWFLLSLDILVSDATEICTLYPTLPVLPFFVVLTLSMSIDACAPWLT